MALAHPPRPIRSRSRNKRQNMWVGWYASSWWSWFWSVYSIHYYIHTTYYICILIEMIKINSFWRVGVVCMVCRMIRYCYPFLLGFECIFKSYSSRFAIIWYCSLVGCTLSEFIWLVLGCVLFWRWVSFSVPFTNSLNAIASWWLRRLLFQAILSILKYTFGLSVTT